MKRLLAITLPCYLLDQLTKWLVEVRMPFGSSIPVIEGLFNLVHVGNTGAAFGIGKGNNLFFVALSLVALGALVVLGKRGHLADPFSRAAAPLLASGILGNLTDRLARGHVVDFLDFHWRGWHWPAFNIADTCICIAAGLFVLSSFKSPTRDSTASDRPK